MSAEFRSSIERKRQNVIQVSQASDFGVPVAGVITVPMNIVYEIDFPGIIVMPSALFIQDDSNFKMEFINNTSLISYTGSGSFIRSDSSLSMHFESVFVLIPSGVKFFDVTGSGVLNGFIKANTLIIIGGIAGDLRSFDVLFFTVCAVLQAEDGYNIENCNRILISGTRFENGANSIGSVFLTFSVGTFQTIILDKLLLNPKSNESIFDFKAAITINNLLLVNSVNRDIAGQVFAAGSKDPTQKELLFSSNTGIRSSFFIYSASFCGNVLTTTIATQNTPVLVNAVWVKIQSERFTFDANGIPTTDLLEDENFRIQATLSIDPVGGASIEVTVYIAINGSVKKPESGVSATIKDKVPVIAILQAILSDGDTVDVYVENNSGTANLNITNGILDIGMV